MNALQVEQRSELVDVVTRLAKEEAAAEKGAAAAAKADAASGTAVAAAAADKPDLVLSAQAASKRNAAAALKQVDLLEQPVPTWQILAQIMFLSFILPDPKCCAKDLCNLRCCTVILIVRLLLYGQTVQQKPDLDTMVSNHAYTCAVLQYTLVQINCRGQGVMHQYHVA